jgi:two-component system alkaline phosphatase synthesis response regulator PhoP
MTTAKILIVDDDKDFLKITKTILQSNNYKIITAANGEQALVAMRREKPDLVILDIMMAYILDGLDVRRAMAEDNELKNIPVIMATSLTAEKAKGTLPTDEYVPEAEWLHKPIDPDVLLERVKKVLKK